MPQRTDPFQHLIFLVKQQLAESGAVVTESKMLPDRHLEDTTEVDTCIETSIAGHNVVISFECRHSSRPLGKGWVQQMWAKHENLQTSVLVLVSDRGFTKSALIQANKYGVETLKLDQVDADSVTGLLERVRALCMKTVSFTATKILIHLEETDCRGAEIVDALPENNLVDLEGKHLGLVRGLVEIILKDDRLVVHSLREGSEEHRSFQIEWQQHQDATPKFCLQESGTAMIRPIVKMDLTGIFEAVIGRFEMKHGNLGNVQVSWGKGEFDGKKSVLVVTQDEKGTPRLSLDTGNVIWSSGVVKRPDGRITIGPTAK